MTRLRRTGLKIDDPLTPTAANDQMPTAVPGRDEEHAAGPSGGPSGSTQSPKPRPSPAPRARSERTLGSGPATSATKKAPTQAATAITTNGAWRAWSGQTRVASYRLPDELLAELASTSAELQLPIGLLVTAAIARLLDEPAAAIAALVDRADDARIEGRRAARRSASGRHPEAPTGHPKRPVRCRWSWALISVATRQSTPQSTRSW